MKIRACIVAIVLTKTVNESEVLQKWIKKYNLIFFSTYVSVIK
jgi:hypothetical protein